MLIFLAGTPLLYLAQPVTVALRASGYTGFTGRLGSAGGGGSPRSAGSTYRSRRCLAPTMGCHAGEPDEP